MYSILLDWSLVDLGLKITVISVNRECSTSGLWVRCGTEPWNPACWAPQPWNPACWEIWQWGSGGVQYCHLPPAKFQKPKPKPPLAPPPSLQLDQGWVTCPPPKNCSKRLDEVTLLGLPQEPDQDHQLDLVSIHPGHYPSGLPAKKVEHHFCKLLIPDALCLCHRKWCVNISERQRECWC